MEWNSYFHKCANLRVFIVSPKNLTYQALLFLDKN